MNYTQSIHNTFILFNTILIPLNKILTVVFTLFFSCFYSFSFNLFFNCCWIISILVLNSSNYLFVSFSSNHYRVHIILLGYINWLWPFFPILQVSGGTVRELLDGLRSVGDCRALNVLEEVLRHHDEKEEALRRPGDEEEEEEEETQTSGEQNEAFQVSAFWHNSSLNSDVLSLSLHRRVSRSGPEGGHSDWQRRLWQRGGALHGVIASLHPPI